MNSEYLFRCCCGVTFRLYNSNILGLDSISLVLVLLLDFVRFAMLCVCHFAFIYMYVKLMHITIPGMTFFGILAPTQLHT